MTASVREAKHEAKEHKQRDLWQQTIEAGRAVQQAAEVQKATDQIISEVDQSLASKEKEIMTV